MTTTALASWPRLPWSCGDAAGKQRAAPQPEVNRNRIPAASTSSALKPVQIAALKAAGNADLARLEETLVNWGGGHSLSPAQRSPGGGAGARPRQRGCAVEQLTMEGFNLEDIVSLTRVPAFMHVRVLSLKRCQYVSSVGALGRLPHLQELDLSLSGVSRLDGLERSTSLQTIKVASCHQLQSLSALGGVASLRVIVASQSAVYDVSGLAQSRSLVSVKLYGCPALTDVSALGAIPTLQELAASESNVVTIDGIGHSPSLALVGLRYCDIVNLTPLSTIATLAVLNVSCTPVRSVEALRTCTRLRQLDVSGCMQLHSLSPLGCLPNLQVIDASNCAVEDVSGLRVARSLEKLDLTNCWRLERVGALGACPRLATLQLSCSSARGLAGLQMSDSLRVVDISYCKRITADDISTIKALPPLERLNVAGCTAVQHLLHSDEEAATQLKYGHRTFEC